MKKFIPIYKPSIGIIETAYVNDAVKSGWVSSLGKYIEIFEEQFALFCGTKYALAASNGTTALHLALLSIGIQPGDEVIVPDLTFVATANAVAYIGAKPVFADIETETLGISAESVRAVMTQRTRAIVPVHLYGQPVEMDPILQLARENDLFVVEDAAEAHGAEYRGKRVGNLGCCGIFSFYGNKIITTGEGGMLTTNDDNIYIKAKRLRDHAMSPNKRYWHEEVGYNYRLTNIQAALGVGQLERIDKILNKKKLIMSWYRERLLHNKRLRLNRDLPHTNNVYWLVCAEIDGIAVGEREQIMAELKKKNIDSRPYFYPISDMPMYNKASTPFAHLYSSIGLNLPSYYDLTEMEVEYICESFLKIID